MAGTVSEGEDAGTEEKAAELVGTGDGGEGGGAEGHEHPDQDDRAEGVSSPHDLVAVDGHGVVGEALIREADGIGAHGGVSGQ